MCEYQIKKIGSNIRALRMAFGETQLDLALALNFDSPAAVSMYESGTRGQNRVEVLARIAWHYRITLDELLYKDFSGLPQTVEKLELLIFGPDLSYKDRRQKVSELFVSLFPASPAASETLRRHLIRQAHAAFPGFAPAFSRFCRNEISWIEFVRLCWTRDASGINMTVDMAADMAVTMAANMAANMAAADRTLLVELYQSDKWYQLAEYYQALQYVLGLEFADCGGDLDSDSASAMAAGRAMIISLARLGNPHAGKLTEFVRGLHSL